MSAILILITLAVLFLAYSNGANDNFKGVATLFGSGTAGYRVSLLWATITTLSGALLALLLAHGLVDTFKGKGLVPEAVTAQSRFVMAVSLGAALTIMLATRLGMPVSTTHALTGGLVGAGLCAAASDLRLDALGTSVLLPLLCSPLAALFLTVAIYPLFRGIRRRWGITSHSCICIGSTYEAVLPQPDGSLQLVRSGAVVEAGQSSQCVERYQGQMLGLEAGRVADALHFLSAGAVGFARGLNDTPKIVAMLLAASVLSPGVSLLLVALAMASGGILNARRIAETMSKKITRMNPGQGLTANLVTSALVILASRFALPVSTTHIAVGSLFGVGMVNRTAQAGTILAILLAWVITLPLGAALGACVYLLLQVCGTWAS